jgi:6-pyruvoyltetrahydropterin/6-carboxytetrahydropterin synthase
MLTIGKRYYFDAAHSLPGHPKCNPLHGHTWTLDISIRSNQDYFEVLENNNDMLMDFHVLNDLVKKVLGTYDHHDLNEKAKMPTCENLIHQLWKDLTAELPEGYSIASLRLQEGQGGWAEL